MFILMSEAPTIRGRESETREGSRKLEPRIVGALVSFDRSGNTGQ